MNEHEKRGMVVEIAKHYLGTWYKWGGDDPGGFDCSGLVIECLKSVGVLPRNGDWTAHELWIRYRIRPENPYFGDLVFWHAKNDVNRIIHVEIAVNNKLSIGASGGGAFVKTEKNAQQYNSYIKIRPFDTRKNIKGFANPYH